MTDFGVSPAVTMAVLAAITERTSKPVTVNSRLVEDLGLDSLTIVDLTQALELEFEFQVDYTPSRMQTVHDVMLFIEHLLVEERKKSGG